MLVKGILYIIIGVFFILPAFDMADHPYHYGGEIAESVSVLVAMGMLTLIATGIGNIVEAQRRKKREAKQNKLPSFLPTNNTAK